ncbi:MAG: SGNH/GDSL hydrolase family protein [Anaerolineae bacterium]|nr:SGNH/GDSL hydrolase family protein [Anaerolineae bacterium]
MAFLNQPGQPVRRALALAAVVVLAALASLPTGAPMHAQGDPTGAPTAEPAEPFEPLPAPSPDSLDEAALEAIDLRALPVIPDLEENAAWLRAIYAEGQRQGRNPLVFSRIGDCMTASESFLVPIATGEVDLDRYTSLQTVIDRFAGQPVREVDGAPLDSFANLGLAATSGFNAAGVLDATWADPAWCEADESPLACEIRVSNPAFAFVMFGTNDLRSLTPVQFDYYLRQVLVETVNAGVLPIVVTFPNQPGQEERSMDYNRVAAAAAADYRLPLVNLWRAFEPLPTGGIDPEQPTHMTSPASGNAASFSEADLQAGHNLHNLLSLQGLEAVLGVVGK